MAVSKRLRFEVLRRDNHACRYCGGVAPNVVLTVDHVLPVALGGRDEAANLVAACRECNAGKSSVPADAAVVDDVAADALRWAQAMQTVAAQRAVEREEAQERYSHFLARWNSWTYTYMGETETVQLPNAWQRSLDQFLDAGLAMEDIEELIEVAMTARTRDEWKYFCGCCWRRISEIQDRAREIVAAASGSPPGSDAPLTSPWTMAEVDEEVAASESVADSQLLDWQLRDSAYCRHRKWGQGDCGDPICRIARAQDLKWLADRALLDSWREDAVMEEAEALLDG